MHEAFVEQSLYDYFRKHFEDENQFGGRVAVNETGVLVENRSGLWVWPRIVRVFRPLNSRHGQEVESFSIETTCYVKSEPKGKRDPRRFSRLIDSTRRLVDGAFDAPAIPVRDDKNRLVAKMTMNNAESTRSYNQSVLIGSTSVAGVDSCLLLTTGVLSPVSPDPRAASQ